VPPTVEGAVQLRRIMVEVSPDDERTPLVRK
jgi:hypothetical protein